MGVAREIGEHGLRPGKRRFSINHPTLLANRRKVTLEGSAIVEPCLLAEEDETPCIVQCEQPGQEQTAEQRAEHSYRQQEGWSRWDPPPIRCDAATGHDHVDVRMVGHGRAPGVEHGGGADAGAQVLWVSGDGQHGPGRRLEQQVVDQRLVVEGNVGDLGGQREDHMEVADRQEIGRLGFEPGACRCALAPGTMPVAAGVVGDPLVPAVRAGFHMTTKRSGTTGLDRRHDLELVQAQMPGMRGAISRTRSTENVGDLDGVAHRSGVGWLRRWNEDAQLVERTGHGPHRARRHLGVEGGVLQLGVTEQRLDNADIDAVFQKMGGEAVPQGMRADAPGNLGR